MREMLAEAADASGEVQVANALIVFGLQVAVSQVHPHATSANHSAILRNVDVACRMCYC